MALFKVGGTVALETAERNIYDFEIAPLSGGGIAASFLEQSRSATSYRPVRYDLVYSNALIENGTDNRTELDHYWSRVTNIEPAVTATPDGGFVVGIQTQHFDNSITNVFGYAFEADADRQKGWLFNSTGSSGGETQEDLQLVTLADGTVAGIWGEGPDSYTRVFRTDSTPVGDVVHIEKGEGGYLVPVAAAALEDGGYVAAFNGQSGDSYSFQLRRFAADGSPVGDIISRPSINRLADVVGLPGGGFVVAAAKSGAQFSDFGRLEGAVYGPDGTQLGDDIRFDDLPYYDDSDSRMSLSALSQGGFAIAYPSPTPREPGSSRAGDVDLVVRLFDANGVPTGASQVIALPDAADGDDLEEQMPDLVQLANGDLVLAWLSETPDGGSDSLYAQVLRLPAPGGVITGTPAGELIPGTTGDDSILGLGGADWITPGPGSDSIDGGDGSDMLSFVDLDQRVAVNLATGTAISGRETDTFTSVENVSGTIYGDLIEGDAGNNKLRGLGGYDWFVGSGGADSYEGSNGRDMISYVRATDRVGVDLGAQSGLFGQALGDSYDSIERATGSSFGDLFYGSDGEDEFRGLGGYDWFVGSGGGRDRYDGGSGMDTVSYAFSGAGVVASLLRGYGSGGDAARDLYTSIENLTGSNFDDILTGDNGRNILRGQYGEDVLYGNGGTDYLTGGGSDDVLYGGAGWDVAVYEGNKADYRVFTAGDLTSVTYLPGGGEGTDLVLEIEALSFADGFVYL